MKNPVFTAFSGFARTAVLLLASAAGAVYAAEQNGVLMGGLYTIGNDGAAEAGENPAFLVFGPAETRHSLNIRTQAARAHNVGVTGIGTTGAGQWQAAGDISFALSGLMDKRLALGITLQDIRNPTYQKLGIDARTFLTAQNTDLNAVISNRSANFGAAVGLGFRLGPKDALGLKARLNSRTTYDKNTGNLAAGAFAYNSETLNETTTQSIIAALSYLHHSENTDLALSFGNIGFEYTPASFAYSEATLNGGAIVASRYETQNWSNRNATDPYFSLGLRQRLFADIHFFGEAIAQTALDTTGRDTLWRENDPKTVVARDYTRSGDPGFSLGAGFALGLTRQLTAHIGARAQKGRSTTTYLASDQNSREQHTNEVVLANASLGLTLRRGLITWHAGAMYLYQQISIDKKRSYTYSGADYLSPNSISITLDGYGLFFGAAADF